MFHVVRHREGMKTLWLAPGNRRIDWDGASVSLNTYGLIIEFTTDAEDEAIGRCNALLNEDKALEFYILDNDARVVYVLMHDERRRELERKSVSSEFWQVGAITFFVISLTAYISAAFGEITWLTAFYIHLALSLLWLIQVKLKINNPIESGCVVTIFSILIPILIGALNKAAERRHRQQMLQQMQNDDKQK